MEANRVQFLPMRSTIMGGSVIIEPRTFPDLPSDEVTRGAKGTKYLRSIRNISTCWMLGGGVVNITRPPPWVQLWRAGGLSMPGHSCRRERNKSELAALVRILAQYLRSPLNTAG